ncbi:MAG: sulfite exporter TauE/SafE family protein [Myxococcota bacterium]
MTLFVSVFLASIVGSVHCMGMCGPLVALYADGGHRSSAHALYHTGRLLAYATLGALAGAFGGLVDLAGALVGIAGLATVAAAAAIAGWGVLKILETTGLRPARPHGQSRLLKVVGAVNRRVFQLPHRTRATMLGLTSALLPCGWLYAFVAVAAGTGDARYGAAAMAGFWLGSVPALLAIGIGAQRILAPIQRRIPWLPALGIVLVGLGTVASRAYNIEELPTWSDAQTFATQVATDAPPDTPPCH